MNKNTPMTNSIGKKPAAGPGTSSGAGSNKNQEKHAPHLAVSKKPGQINGYMPSYVAPPEPTVLPAPNVVNEIDLPARFDLTTLDDLCKRIYGAVSLSLLLRFPSPPLT
jgi:hypothetical protein